MLKKRHPVVKERQTAIRPASAQSKQMPEQSRAEIARPRTTQQAKQPIFNAEEKLEIISDKVKQVEKITVKS